MRDDVPAGSEIDGSWEGYYDHDNALISEQSFPITATLTSGGGKLRGTMIDGVTNIVRLYRKIVDAHQGRLSPRAERAANAFLEKFPDYRFETTLPEESRLEGRFDGDRVLFTKTYLGDYSIRGSSTAGRTLLLRIRDHRVLYEGTLDPDLRTIEGRWTIPARGPFGRFRRPQATGRFQLFKEG